MASSQSPRMRTGVALLRGLAAPACLCLGQWVAAAAEPPAPETVAPPAAAVAAQVQVLDLGACRRTALERQPTIAAAQASLAAAEARARGLCRLHAIPVVAGDLPIRREQASLGVAGASAALEQARQDALYDVTRTYLAAVYARAQLKLADDTRRELEKRKEDARTAGKNRLAEQIAVYVTVIEGRRATATEGFERALAALREAMGVGPDTALALDATRLPDPSPAVSRADVIALALSRRGEVVQTATAAGVTDFEVKAQESKRLSPSVRTFASASDIHAQPVPAAGRGAEYHPGAIGPEMPVSLVGKRAERVEQAHALAARAGALAEKTRGLVALEADDAFHRWQETALRLPKAREAADAARAVADKLAEDAKNVDLGITPLEVMTAGLLAGQLRLEANEAHYQHLLNLAALERVTAGGFSAGFEPAPAAQP